MKTHRLLQLTLFAVAPISCARGNSASGDLENAESATAEVYSAVALVGDWDLTSDPPLPPPGLHMSFTVDSADSPRYYGRLSHYFSGNVGADLTAFKPFVGSMDEHDLVEFRVDQVDPAMLGIVVQGRLGVDTIHTNALIIGPDTVSGGDRRWFLVKR